MARREFSAAGEAEVSMALATSADLFKLGLKYCTGLEVSTDLVEAHKWFNLAAARGNAQARRCRSEIAEDMPRQDIFKAQRLARQWLRDGGGRLSVC